MHKPKIFLVGDDREHLITLEETGYVEEAVLQNYLVDYPDLLPGDQIDPENPRRWLLVAQEMRVPGEEEGSGRSWRRRSSSRCGLRCCSVVL